MSAHTLENSAVAETIYKYFHWKKINKPTRPRAHTVSYTVSQHLNFITLIKADPNIRHHYRHTLIYVHSLCSLSLQPVYMVLRIIQSSHPLLIPSSHRDPCDLKTSLVPYDILPHGLYLLPSDSYLKIVLVASCNNHIVDLKTWLEPPKSTLAPYYSRQKQSGDARKQEW